VSSSFSLTGNAHSTKENVGRVTDACVRYISIFQRMEFQINFCRDPIGLHFNGTGKQEESNATYVACQEDA